MSVDKFGRTSKRVRATVGKPGIGFILDNIGNYSLEHKRITKLSDPINDLDACNKKYTDSLYLEISKQLSELLSKQKSTIDTHKEVILLNNIDVIGQQKHMILQHQDEQK